MDYLSGKVTMLVGEASSRVNETRRKWQQQKHDDKRTVDQPRDGANSDNNSATKESTAPHRTIASPLASGCPFGGDSLGPAAFASTPPIGFRIYASGEPVGGQQRPSEPQGRQHLGDSDASLYEGDAWARLWFQRVMTLSLLRLLLFVRKVYEDFQATKVYNLTGQTGHFLIAFATLFLPTIFFTVYRVARYLQLALPPIRLASSANQQRAGGPAASTTADSLPQRPQRARASRRNDENADDSESQLTRALMSSPVQSVSGPATPTPTAAQVPPPPDEAENDGLVTARQTPVPNEEFQDAVATPEAIEVAQLSAVRAPSPLGGVDSRTQTPASEQLAGTKLESVNVNKLNVADRQTFRVFTGASEQLLHGALFIFWQLKRQVDVLGYLVERACLWRKPAEREKEELDRLRTGADGLEWFQDFYAAFLAILTQVYTLGLHWSDDDSRPASKLQAAQLNAATSSLGSSDLGGPGGEPSISQSARTISGLLSSQAIAGDVLGGKDVLIMSELIVSSAVVVSLLVAVRRRDDGPLTLGLSMLGWGSLFAGRIIIIALAFVHLGWRLMLPLVVLHVLLITGWIYHIALASHNDRPSERSDEAKWDEETAIEVANQQELELEQRDKGKRASELTEKEPAASEQLASRTSQWSFMEHLVLLAQIVTLFAIPSLFYWPIMFNLKLHFRPFKYLVLILIENFLLIPAIWFSLSEAVATAGQLYLLGFVGGSSIMGFIFVSLYISCKPSLTEYFARADELFNEAEKSGVYFEFCSRVFKMPDLSKKTFRRLMNQSEVVVEEVEE